jgi:hypothetical protein
VPVAKLGVSAAEVLHGAADVAARRLREQVVVVGHERVAVDAEAEALGQLSEDGEEHGADILVSENDLAPRAAVHDVVTGARVVESRGAGHAATCGRDEAAY